MWKEVADYTLNFHHKPRRFAIHVKLADGSEDVLDHLSIDEFNCLAMLLRSEAHLWYHTTRGDLAAHSAPLHEEDLD